MTTSRLAKPAGAPSSTGRPPRPRTRTWTGFAQQYALVLIAILLFAICFAMIPQFRSAALISSMLNSNAIVLLLALTATVTLRVGSFDLSIAQVMIASAVLAGVVTGAGLPVLLAAPLAVAFGAAVGLLNGWLVVKMGVDSFIVTLGTFTAVAGLSLLLSGSKLVTTVPDVLSTITGTPFLGLPLVIWYSWLLAAILWFIYQRTPLGRYMLFIGGNATAAKLSGVRVDALRLGSFVTSGTLAAVIGLVYAGYFGTIDPSIGGASTCCSLSPQRSWVPPRSPSGASTPSAPWWRYTS